MLTIWEHARSITEPLADSLGELEVRPAGPESNPASTRHSPRAVVRDAIAAAWRLVVDDAERGRADHLTVGYLAGLHERLAAAAGAEAPGEFSDEGQPATWSVFVEQCSVEGPPEEAWVLAQLRWGRHVRSMAMSLGWLAMNSVRLRQGLWSIYPPPSDLERLLRILGDAGPDLYDAEGLRALLWTYARGQQPPGVASATA